MDKPTSDNSNKYWLSLDQWRQDPQFLELANKEFQSSPLSEESQNGWGRRDFLKLMGASLALGSFGCTRKPVNIVPYVNRPQGLVPGVSNFYASTFHMAGEVLGLVVRTREGRPIKNEGNEFFPAVGEALSVRGQAQLLSVYDPDRLAAPIQNLLNEKRSNRDTIASSWEIIDEEMTTQLKKGGAFVLSGANPSETSRKVISDFVSKFGGEHFQWSPLSYERFRKSFSALGSDRKTLPRFRISKANFILSIATDFLGVEYGSLQNSVEWGEARDVSKREPVKLMQAESLMSLTGTNADSRVQLKPSEYLSFLCAVISKMNSSSSYAKQASNYAGVKALSSGVLEMAETAAKELKENVGKSIVMGFGLQAKTADYDEIQKAVHFLNAQLDNDGTTIDYSQAPFASFLADESSMETLIEKMNAGAVKTLIIHESNPAYTYSDQNKFRKALTKVSKVIYTGDRNDETGRVSHFVAPDDHALEKWNEYESLEGVYSIGQPTLSPLYKTRAFEQSLLKWLGTEDQWFDKIKETWKSRFTSNTMGFSSFDEFWVGLLQKGVMDLSKFKDSEKPRRAFAGNFNAEFKKSSGDELVVYQTAAFGEGNLTNVSWLQELPDPVTKIVWDNYASVSMGYAEKHSITEGDVIELKVGEGKNSETVKLPVHVQPGQEENTIGVAVGFGRYGAGKVCDDVGKNVYPLVNGTTYSGIAVSVDKTIEKIVLANCQGHYSMEGRQIVAEASYSEFKKKESAGIHKHKIFSLWSKHKYTKEKWAMSVDLSKCTGCSACVVACQSENNIPVVGKKHVLNGREMHWIRIDRYYSGDPKAPRVLHQPVMCQHCDNAPCETVCPVLATVHSDEGTNDMVYNRCVGTRYCANNCPYKVRRFNWFNYSKVESPLNMALNPEVTVRSRGVMEKCTFCIHKIRGERSDANIEKRKLKDGDVKTACQMTCPTKAIVFGDMNNKDSAVSKKFEEQRTYELLEEINVVPSVRYMTKIWNTDEQIAVSHGGGGHGEEKHGDGEHHEPSGHKAKEHPVEGEAH